MEELAYADQTAAVPREGGAVSAEMIRQIESIEQLYQALEILEHRLDPIVLRKPVNPVDTPEKRAGPALAATLAVHTDRIQAATRRLHELLDAIEL